MGELITAVLRPVESPFPELLARDGEYGNSSIRGTHPMWAETHHTSFLPSVVLHLYLCHPGAPATQDETQDCLVKRSQGCGVERVRVLYRELKGSVGVESTSRASLV